MPLSEPRFLELVGKVRKLQRERDVKATIGRKARAAAFEFILDDELEQRGVDLPVRPRAEDLPGQQVLPCVVGPEEPTLPVQEQAPPAQGRARKAVATI